jgi:hypothetical protein
MKLIPVSLSASSCNIPVQLPQIIFLDQLQCQSCLCVVLPKNSLSVVLCTFVRKKYFSTSSKFLGNARERGEKIICSLCRDVLVDETDLRCSSDFLLCTIDCPLLVSVIISWKLPTHLSPSFALSTAIRMGNLCVPVSKYLSVLLH